MTAISRRAALAGAAALAVPTSAAAVCIAVEGFHKVESLWLKRRELRRLSAAVSASYDDAASRLPEWADSGYEFVRKSDGQGYGCKVGWVALEKPLDAGDHFIVRPHPAQIKHWGEKRPRAEYRAALRDHVKRRREQSRVRDEVGLTFICEESDRLVNEAAAVDEEIVRIAHASADINAAAAHCIIALSYSFAEGDGFRIFDDGAAVLTALRAMRPMLSGVLAEDADEQLSSQSIDFDPDDAA